MFLRKRNERNVREKEEDDVGRSFKNRRKEKGREDVLMKDLEGL